MFFVPGLIPQEAKESEGNRGESQSESDCGVGNWCFLELGFLLWLGIDMVEDDLGKKENDLLGLRVRDLRWKR